MDAPHFGLRHRPFPTTPDSTVYYPATTHEQALAQLLQGLQDNEGILLLTAPPGCGKTLLCHCLLGRLETGRPSILLTNSHLHDRKDLLQALLFDVSLPYEGRSEQEMRLALAEHLLDTFRQGRQTVVLIDEAHHLSPDLLEELRLLGNLEGRSGKAVQVILIGLPALLETLVQSELSGLAQRLAVRATLAPLDVHEAADYLLHHLRVAGGKAEEIFSGEALQLLAQASGGVPRRLNQFARAALAFAVSAGAVQVDVEVALEILAAHGAALHEQPEWTEDSHAETRVLSLPETRPAPDQDDSTRQLSVAPKRPA